MREQQQIRSAKEGSIYLASLCFILLVLLWTIWQNTNFFIPFLICLVFSYFLYRAVNADAFKLVFSVLAKYFKYNKVHDYFEYCKEQQQNKNQQVWGSKTQQKDSQVPQKLFQRIVINHSEIEVSRKLFFYNQRSQFEKGEALNKLKNFQRQAKSQEYLKARDEYKKTIQDLKTKGLEEKQFSNLIQIIKDNYIKSIRQLLKASEQNIKAIKNTVEENLEVKIITNQNIPERLEPVYLDQVLSYINIICITKCLPYSSRIKKENDSSQLLKKLEQLLNVRKKIDATLFDQSIISQKQREQTVKKIFEQLQEKRRGKQLLKVLLEIYNKNVQIDEYKIVWQEMNITKGKLKLVQSSVGDYLHIDLKVSRQGNEKIYRAKPGEDNFWSFFSLAAQLYRLRL